MFPPKFFFKDGRQLDCVLLNEPCLNSCLFICALYFTKDSWYDRTSSKMEIFKKDRQNKENRKKEQKYDAVKVEQLGTLPARPSLAAANQFCENEDFLSVEIQTRISRFCVFGFSTIQR